MAKPLSQYSRGELEQLLKNAKAKGRDDIYRDAFRALCALDGLDENDPLEREFAQVLAAYEQLLSEKHGRKQAAGYTRRKVKNKGVVQTLTDWANHPTSTQGFDMLVAAGLVELTGEYLVLKYAERFPPEVIEAGRARLAGLIPPEIDRA